MKPGLKHLGHLNHLKLSAKMLLKILVVIFFCVFWIIIVYDISNSGTSIFHDLKEWFVWKDILKVYKKFCKYGCSGLLCSKELVKLAPKTMTISRKFILDLINWFPASKMIRKDYTLNSKRDMFQFSGYEFLNKYHFTEMEKNHFRENLGVFC